MAEQIEAQAQELGDFLQRYSERGVHPVLWVGAGASAAAGYPTLGQLEQLLRDQLRGMDKSGFALIDAFIAQYSEADLIPELQRHGGQPRHLSSSTRPWPGWRGSLSYPLHDRL